MDAPALKRVTVPELLAWAEIQDNGRCEPVHSEIVAMAPERSEHVRAKPRAANAPETPIGRTDVAWRSSAGAAVVSDDETCCVPDAPINCGEPGAPPR
jgi:Uma2 family endonuclease